MAYVKTTWTNGATALSAEHMNNIEDGIAALDTGKVDKEVGKGLSTNDYTTEEKTKLSGIETGAEVNQNAFGNVKVGSTTRAADGKTDTLELAAGTGITLTPDATNDKVTIAAPPPFQISHKTITADKDSTVGPNALIVTTVDHGLSSADGFIGIRRLRIYSEVNGESTTASHAFVSQWTIGPTSIILTLANPTSSDTHIARIEIDITYLG